MSHEDRRDLIVSLTLGWVLCIGFCLGIVFAHICLHT